METRRRQLSGEGVKGSFREAGELEEEESEKLYQQTLALLRGRARGSISS